MDVGIEALFDTVQSVIDLVGPGAERSLNESETRAHLIDPILTALGYTALDHVRREYRLDASGQVVDYLLLAAENRVVVEAKSTAADLAAKDASQLVGYCAQEGVRWALLTNGIEWQIFDIEVSGNWQNKRVATLNLRSRKKRGTPWRCHDGPLALQSIRPFQQRQRPSGLGQSGASVGSSRSAPQRSSVSRH